jgi:hypothetical protein
MGLKGVITVGTCCINVKGKVGSHPTTDYEDPEVE